MDHVITVGKRKFVVRFSTNKQLNEHSRKLILEKTNGAETVLVDRLGVTHFCKECVEAEFRDVIEEPETIEGEKLLPAE